ncbi:phosphoenolpyruvate--protein phosphotransferase [Neomoorella thermoacetica]|nr:phosphoenolpyruvate--protein phosphotransferase [Moorella thermoacetica]
MLLKGIAISPGKVIGRAHRLIEHANNYSRSFLTSEVEKEKELARLAQAFNQAKEQLASLIDKTKREIGLQEAKIFEAHLLLLSDPLLGEKIRTKIQVEGKDAVWAVSEATEEIAQEFASLEDEYFRERAVDIRDIGRRLIACLGNGLEEVSDEATNTIIVAEELTPSQTASFSRRTVAGIITEKGGPTSHTAVVARSLGIPAVSGVTNLLDLVKDGDFVFIDGNNGVIHLNPDVEEIKNLPTNGQNNWRDKMCIRNALAKAITRDGHEIEVATNLRNFEEAELALAYGAEGVGLFRTEFLYMNRQEPPGEEEQFLIYRDVLLALKDKPVIVRTLDIGGDKHLPYLEQDKEDNPFLGLRGIRLCLKHKKLFKTQLKALLRASSYGNLKLMFPMVTTLEEIREAKTLLEEAREELQVAGIETSINIPIGIMIEVPAAALMADILASEVDFFSIGTNDLTQYTLAVDRDNEKVAVLYDAYHPAVLKFIYQVVDAAHRKGKWVGLCGELGGDSLAAPLLVGLGLDEISMSPVFIPEMKERIRALSYEEGRELVRRLLELPGAKEVREVLVETS